MSYKFCSDYPVSLSPSLSSKYWKCCEHFVYWYFYSMNVPLEIFRSMYVLTLSSMLVVRMRHLPCSSHVLCHDFPWLHPGSRSGRPYRAYCLRLSHHPRFCGRPVASSAQLWRTLLCWLSNRIRYAPPYLTYSASNQCTYVFANCLMRLSHWRLKHAGLLLVFFDWGCRSLA